MSKPDGLIFGSESAMTENAATLQADAAELAQIAANVAKALGLKVLSESPPSLSPEWIDEDGLLRGGAQSNVFSDHWFRACVEWLLKQDYVITIVFGKSNSHALALVLDPKVLALNCPAIEFPARAINSLMQAKP